MPPPGYGTAPTVLQQQPQGGAPAAPSPVSSPRASSVPAEPATPPAPAPAVRGGAGSPTGDGITAADRARARAVKAAMQPLQAKLDKMSKQRQAQRQRSRSRDPKKEGRRSRSRSREPPPADAATAASTLSRAAQLAITLLVCSLLLVELLVSDPLHDGAVLPGLPDPPGELLALSHGRTHYRLLPPRASSLTGADSDSDSTTAFDRASLNDLPVVVCVHGVATYSYVWEPLAERLRAKGVFVLSYDLWGHGHSDAPDAVYDTALCEPTRDPHGNLISSDVP